jgi:hypothetical protein
MLFKLVVCLVLHTIHVPLRHREIDFVTITFTLISFEQLEHLYTGVKIVRYVNRVPLVDRD